MRDTWGPEDDGQWARERLEENALHAQQEEAQTAADTIILSDLLKRDGPLSVAEARVVLGWDERRMLMVVSREMHRGTGTIKVTNYQGWGRSEINESVLWYVVGKVALSAEHWAIVRAHREMSLNLRQTR